MHYCFLSEMSKTVIILSRLETIDCRIHITACNLKNITIVIL